MMSKGPDEEESEERSKVKKEGPEMIIPQIHGPDEKLYTMPPESVEHFDQHHKNLIGSISARPGSDGLHISWKTAEYILDRSYETDSKEEDVESVLEDLTARIYRLLYDIAILSYGGYMDADTNWTSADGNCDHLNERDFFRTSYRSCFDNNIEIKYNNSSFNWGFDIGLALTSLTGPIAENIESSKFLSGLMTAYTADHVQSGPGYDIYNSVGGDQHWKNEYNSEKEVFKKYGVAHTNYMRRKILGIGINPIDTDKNFRDPISKDVITEFFEDDLGSWFAKCSFLRERLEEEWESINDASVTGLSAENTLETLWDFENKEAFSSKKATSSNISSEIDTYQGTVSHVLNQLSIEGKKPSDSVTREFEHDEIVYYEGGEWKLTDYGKLLLYHVFEREMDPEWLQEAAICDGYKERPSEAGSYSSVQETAISEGDPPPHSNYSEEGQDLLEAAVSYHYE